VQERAAPRKQLTAQTHIQCGILARTEAAMNKGLTNIDVAELGAGRKALVAQRLVGLKAIGVMAISRIFLAQRPIVPGPAAHKEADVVLFQVQVPHGLEHRGNGLALAKVQIRATGLSLQAALDRARHPPGGPIGIGVRAGRFGPDLRAPSERAMELALHALTQLKVHSDGLKTSGHRGREDQQACHCVHFGIPWCHAEVALSMHKKTGADLV